MVNTRNFWFQQMPTQSDVSGEISVFWTKLMFWTEIPFRLCLKLRKKNDGFEPFFVLCSNCFSYANIGGEKIR